MGRGEVPPTSGKPFQPPVRRNESGAGVVDRVPTVLQALRQVHSEPEGSSLNNLSPLPSPLTTPLTSPETAPKRAAMPPVASVDMMALKAMDSQEDIEVRKPSRVGLQIVKAIVSKQKKRFVEDGFDLDLTYITPRVIAMGFPAEGLEAMYRNSQRQVYNFFEKRHEGHYLIVNLCSERTYPAESFNGRVLYCPFDDHNCCPMQQLHDLIVNLNEWLSDHPENVVAIHCKAGKGRTGVVVSCLLVYRNYVKSADEALEAFAWFRTTDAQGVTIPSQQRWVHHYAGLLAYLPDRGARMPAPRIARLQKIQLLSSSFGKEHEVYFKVVHAGGRCWRGDTAVHTLQDEVKPVKQEGCRTWVVDADIVGDIVIHCKERGYKGMVSQPLFRAWTHTGFMGPNIIFTVADLDDLPKGHGLSESTQLLRLVCDA